MEYPLPLTDKLADNLGNHSHKIAIQMIWTDTYPKSISCRVLPSISAVCALRECPGMSDELHDFLLSCKNLRSFSLQRITRRFLLSEALSHPPVSPNRMNWRIHQAMNYSVFYGFDSWPLWENESPWSSLLSLSIDYSPLDLTGFLGAITSHTPRLEKLKIAFDIHISSIKALEQFVSSFNTLKSLECIGWCSLRALSSHTRLVDLKMHAEQIIEQQPGWREFSKLNIGDLEQLSLGCPDIRWLGLDAQLEDGELVRI